MRCWQLNPENPDQKEFDKPMSECLGCWVYDPLTRGEIQKHYNRVVERLELCEKEKATK